jgi:putative polyhydroxyalkanoate system protein
MADISLKRSHQLGLKGAKTAANKMAERLEEKFDLVSEWEGHTLTFQRPGVNGALVITEADMKLEVTLGLMLKMMKGPIEKAIHENLDAALASGTTAAKKPAPAKAVPKKK